MKKHKSKLILVLSIFFVTGVLTYIGNGCSRSQSQSPINSASLAPPASGGTTTSSSDIPVIPGARTVSLAYSKQVVDQLSACSGLALPSERTMAMYEQKKGQMSTYGAANTVTGPMMIAVASIAGEICNDLIDQELAVGARLFNGYSMTAAVLPNNTQLSDTITKFALSCWQRNESASERSIIINMITSSVGAAEALAGRKSALMICTSMLSSLDSIVN